MGKMRSSETGNILFLPRENTMKINTPVILMILGGLFLIFGSGAADPVVVNPSPIKAAGLHILIVEETADRGKLPVSQVTQIAGLKLLLWAKEHCKDVDGQPAIRRWDKDIPLEFESKVWRDAMARPRESLPWLLVGDGKMGFEGPLPLKIEDTLKILEGFIK